MTFFSLYSSCSLTEGFNKSCLIDFDRSTYVSLPNELNVLLQGKTNININVLKNKFSNEDFEVVNQYLSFLKENKFIFYHEDKISLMYLSNTRLESSYELEDFILDVRSIEDFKFKRSKIPPNVEIVSLRLYFKITIEELKTVMGFFMLNGNTNVELIFNHNKSNSNKSYIDIFNKFKIISKMIIFGHESNNHLLPKQILLLKKQMKSQSDCGIISDKLFFPNLRTYLSSNSCNSCLNKKISIDIDGNIRNCPSMNQSFGNIKDTSLEEALGHKDFKKYWGITKDQIEVCKDCEFRYICTDCRAYKENPEDDYSKPLKCGYDPYTNKWSEWSKNPLKQKAIDFYGMKEIIIK